MEDSGTKKWCSQCKAIRVVEAVQPSSIGQLSDQHCFVTAPEGIYFYRRGQRCQTCNHSWLSAEVPEGIIDEFVKLRVLLRADLKRVEEYSKESEENLARLNKSLSDLRAFSIVMHKLETRTTS